MTTVAALAKLLRDQEHAAFVRAAARHTVYSLGRSPIGADAFPGDPWPHRFAGAIEIPADLPLDTQARLHAKVIFELAVLNETSRRQSGLASSLTQIHAETAELPRQARVYLSRRLTGVYRSPREAADSLLRAIAGVKSAADLADLAERLKRTPSDFGRLVGRSVFGIPWGGRGYARLTLRESAESLAGSARALLDTQSEYEERADLVVRDLGVLRTVSDTWRHHLGPEIVPDAAPGAHFRRSPEGAIAALKVLAAAARIEAAGGRIRHSPDTAAALALLESSMLPAELQRRGTEPQDILGLRASLLASRHAAEEVAHAESLGAGADVSAARSRQRDVESFDLSAAEGLYPREAVAVRARRRGLEAWHSATVQAAPDHPQELPFSPDAAFSQLVDWPEAPEPDEGMDAAPA